MIVLHEKVKNTAAGVATEAVINSLLLADRKRRRLLAVKRAEPHMVAAGFFERDVIADDFDDRSAISNLGDFILTDHFRQLETKGAIRCRALARTVAGENLFFADADQVLGQPRQRRDQIGAGEFFPGRLRQQG